MLTSENKNKGIFFHVTEKFISSLERIIKNTSSVTSLEKEGYKIDKSVLARFGYLLVCQNMELLSKNPDLLLAAAKRQSSEMMILKIEKGSKK